MTVAITFEPAHLTGLVAEGVSVLDAAKRMGVRLPATCDKGEQCRSCVVLINKGAALLSQPGEAEQKLLIELILAPGHRLACQTIMERSGELIVTIPETDHSGKQETLKDVRKAFGELPFNQKLTALVQLEAVTMSEALDALVGRTKSVVDVLARKARAAKNRGGSANR
jgi:2Fe-2S ferredoxin